MSVTLVEGMLDLHPDGYGFLKPAHQSRRPLPFIVYVNPAMIVEEQLEEGDLVLATARAPEGGLLYGTAVELHAVLVPNYRQMVQRGISR